ncbi:hypothetical protein HYALB_00001935 [Hymenoscyphus albidus]|uniref:Uncharacterized protein n=1 Tax=Hymenoscyphus albidus TaxID=595503 RepID=A0A9N9LDN8_9HELO|nr:hypothetical protein HYALB_00001935 [Hymenoscyphus albidus]
MRLVFLFRAQGPCIELRHSDAWGVGRLCGAAIPEGFFMSISGFKEAPPGETKGLKPTSRGNHAMKKATPSTTRFSIIHIQVTVQVLQNPNTKHLGQYEEKAILQRSQRSWALWMPPSHVHHVSHLKRAPGPSLEQPSRNSFPRKTRRFGNVPPITRTEEETKIASGTLVMIHQGLRLQIPDRTSSMFCPDKKITDVPQALGEHQPKNAKNAGPA